jgi:hypothetical protein
MVVGAAPCAYAQRAPQPATRALSQISEDFESLVASVSASSTRRSSASIAKPISPC